jgi:hypothetical protein
MPGFASSSRPMRTACARNLSRRVPARALCVCPWGHIGGPRAHAVRPSKGGVWRISSQRPDPGRPRRRGNRGRDTLTPRGMATGGGCPNPSPPTRRGALRAPSLDVTDGRASARERAHAMRPYKDGVWRICSQRPDPGRPRPQGSGGRAGRSNSHPPVGAHCVRPRWTQLTAWHRQGRGRMQCAPTRAGCGRFLRSTLTRDALAPGGRRPAGRSIPTPPTPRGGLAGAHAGRPSGGGGGFWTTAVYHDPLGRGRPGSGGSEEISHTPSW